MSVFGLLLLLALTRPLVYSQCLNTLAVYNPNLRSECVNGTYFIVPVNTTLVEAAVKPYSLVPPETADKTLFPNGFPAGFHPVLVSISLGSDIRMSVFQLPSSLMQGSIAVPNVDRLGDGKSGFLYDVKDYIGGTNGDALSALVPSAVGTLEGTTITPATFNPDTAPYQLESSPPPEFLAQIKVTFVPNPISGPEVTLSAVDMDFFTSSTSLYTSHTFHYFISQPLIQNNGGLSCQRNPIYFNQTFANPSFLSGTVTLYSTVGAFPEVYPDVEGYAASGVQLGYNPQSCQDAYDSSDPTAQA